MVDLTLESSRVRNLWPDGKSQLVRIEGGCRVQTLKDYQLEIFAARFPQVVNGEGHVIYKLALGRLSHEIALIRGFADNGFHCCPYPETCQSTGIHLLVRAVI
jgi:hypothetical protein